MDKRGTNYSDRPRMVLIHELWVSWTKLLTFPRILIWSFSVKVNSPTFMPYGDRWRKHRRLIQQNFTPRTIVQYQPAQEYEIRKLLEDLRQEPEEFRRHVRRFIASVMLTVAYGYRVTSVDDPFIELIERTNKLILGPGLPGATTVDHFPFRRFCLCSKY